MHASIRRYKAKGNINEAIDLIKKEFIPAMARMPSFLAYYAMDAGDDVVVTISVFEDAAGADASNREAAKLVGEKLSDLVDGPPEITSGEVLAAES